MKIAVYAIAHNEASFIRRFCEAASEADVIVIGDTGSDDDTVALAREYGAIVHDLRVRPWRFDDARNAVLALIPEDIEVCVSADLDEVLQPGWRQEIERVWTGGVTNRLRYKFDWGVGIVFYYEKIHARFGYRWHHPVHEYVIPDGRTTEVWAQTDMLLLIHKPDPAKSRGQYLDLLRISIEEDPHCPRNAFYYARELSFHGRWAEAIVQAMRYLALPRATWQNERCYAMRVIGRCYDSIGQQESAKEWFRKACAEAPNTREPWCDLAGVTYRTAAWTESYEAATKALAITNREAVYTCDPACWGALPHDLASIAAWNLGLHDVAEEQARLAIDLDPVDPRLRENLALIQKAA